MRCNVLRCEKRQREKREKLVWRAEPDALLYAFLLGNYVMKIEKCIVSGTHFFVLLKKEEEEEERKEKKRRRNSKTTKTNGSEMKISRLLSSSP